MMWDGAAAFNHNEIKLKRLNGKKPRWCDRFRNKDTLYSLIVFLILYSFVVHYEIIKFGSEKSIKYA